MGGAKKGVGPKKGWSQKRGGAKKGVEPKRGWGKISAPKLSKIKNLDLGGLCRPS